MNHRLSADDRILLKLIALNVDVGVFAILDNNGVLIESNSILRKTVHSAESMEGCRIEDFVDINREEWTELKSCSDKTIMNLRIRPDQTLYKFRFIPYRGHFILFGDRIDSSGPDTLAVIAHEVSEIANLSRELKKKNRELESANQKILELMKTDPLTGLHNRHHFLENLKDSIKTAIRYSYPLTLIMGDLDHFKEINDEFGHDAGDTVLKAFAGIMMESCRSSDYLVRYGGEEFIILLPHTTLEQAVNVAEKIRIKLKNGNIIKGRTITASFGIALSGKGDSELSLIKKADTALYRAKGNGRDRICLFGNEEV